jgi:hypothetical protein
MDQRKVNMLAREYCDDIKRKLKPIILSHRMMPGLLEVRANRYNNAWNLLFCCCKHSKHRGCQGRLGWAPLLLLHVSSSSAAAR